LAASIVTTHGSVPVHAPDQPVNTEVAAGAAVSVTTVPWAKEPVAVKQVVLQLMPLGVDVTVPVPVPALVKVKARVARLKVAVTVAAALIVIAQVPVPVQPPDQPANTEFGPTVAVRTTGVVAR
jgi:hypothetical protein